MFGIGLPELIFIFILALIVLGPEKLPEVAKQLAKLVVDVKKAANEFQKQLELEDEEQDLLKLTEVKQEDFINPRGLIKEQNKENTNVNTAIDPYDWEKELPKSPEEASRRAGEKIEELNTNDKDQPLTKSTITTDFSSKNKDQEA